MVWGKLITPSHIIIQANRKILYATSIHSVQSSQGGNEVRTNSQDTGIYIIAKEAVIVRRVPPDLDVILGNDVNINV